MARLFAYYQLKSSNDHLRTVVPLSPNFFSLGWLNYNYTLLQCIMMSISFEWKWDKQQVVMLYSWQSHYCFLNITPNLRLYLFPHLSHGAVDLSNNVSFCLHLSSFYCLLSTHATHVSEKSRDQQWCRRSLTDLLRNFASTNFLSSSCRRQATPQRFVSLLGLTLETLAILR